MPLHQAVHEGRVRVSFQLSCLLDQRRRGPRRIAERRVCHFGCCKSRSPTTHWCETTATYSSRSKCWSMIPPYVAQTEVIIEVGSWFLGPIDARRGIRGTFWPLCCAFWAELPVQTRHRVHVAGIQGAPMLRIGRCTSVPSRDYFYAS